MDPETVQAAAAVASLLASFVIGVVAIRVAIEARTVAQDANRISEDARDIARDALVAARRQTALAAVPTMAVDKPRIGVPNINVALRNAGPSVAYGVIATVGAARSRSVDDVDATTLRSSGRRATVMPSIDSPTVLSVDASELVAVNPVRTIHPWTYVRVEYSSPLGSSVRQDYLWDGRAKWRLHRLRIEPGPGAGEPLLFDLPLGRGSEDED
jgi:hypothetical protein